MLQHFPFQCRWWAGSPWRSCIPGIQWELSPLGGRAVLSLACLCCCHLCPLCSPGTSGAVGLVPVCGSCSLSVCFLFLLDSVSSFRSWKSLFLPFLHTGGVFPFNPDIFIIFSFSLTTTILPEIPCPSQLPPVEFYQPFLCICCTSSNPFPPFDLFPFPFVSIAIQGGFSAVFPGGLLGCPQSLGVFPQCGGTALPPWGSGVAVQV